jgi:flagellar biosynthetic protein FliP
MNKTLPPDHMRPASRPGHRATLLVVTILVVLATRGVPAEPLPDITTPWDPVDQPLMILEDVDDPGSTVSQSESSLPDQLQQMTRPEGILSTVKLLVMLTVVSLAPAILLMTTCYVRVVIVLGLLRQALGAQQLPSNQVLASLAMFITLLVMGPTWKQVYQEGIVPYSNGDVELSEAWENGKKPLVSFMGRQIDRAGNTEDVWLFYRHLPPESLSLANSSESGIPTTYDEVPIQVLLPAFLLSELKTAFLIGFQIYLPFLILDLIVATVITSMGMLMLPPTLLSLPFKLMLFVLVDGWRLIVGMLLSGFSMSG